MIFGWKIDFDSDETMLFTFPAEENDLCVFPLIFMDCNSLGIV
jgi:hypothetical protein